MARIALLATFAALAATAVPADTVEAPVPQAHVSPAGHAFTLLPIAEADYVHVSLQWPGAAALSYPGKEGLYSLGPMLVFEEAGGRRLDEIGEDLTDAGANLHLFNTLAGPQIVLQAQTTDGLTPAAAAANAVLTDPTPAEEDLDWLKDTIRDGLAEGERDPGNLLDRALGVVLADGDGRLSALTNRPVARVDAVTSDDVRDWIAASFDGDPVAVAAGPLSPEAAGSAIDAVLTGLGDRPAPVALTPLTLRTEAVTAVIDAPEGETALVGVSFPVSLSDPAVSVALDVLTSGDGSRLFERLREAEGATYGVTLALTPLTPDLMTAALVANVPPERARETLDVLRAEISRLRLGGVTEAELAAARERMMAQEALFLRDPGSIASIAVDQITLGQAVSPNARRESDAMTDVAAINAALPGAIPAEVAGVIVTPRPDLSPGDCLAVTPEDLTGCDRTN